MGETFTGNVWVFGDDINTDLMYPHICYTLPANEKPRYTMWANRPGWVDEVKAGDIIVAGKNFGVGSSRPAADNLNALGISVVLAESINGLFLRNSVNSGLRATECKGITTLVKEGDRAQVDFELGRFMNLSTNQETTFTPLPAFLMEIIKAGGIIEVLREKGYIDDTPL